MVRIRNPFTPKGPQPVILPPVEDAVDPPVPVVLEEERQLCPQQVEALADETIGRLAAIVLDRTQAGANQHGLYAEISLKDCALTAPNGDRADLIAHGGKVTLEYQACRYVPRSMNPLLDCLKPTSITVDMSVTAGRQSERQGEASGEMSAEAQMEGGMAGFKGSAKGAMKATGRSGRKDGDATTQVVSAKVPQQIISGSPEKEKVEITIDPLLHANGVPVRSHGRLWKDQVTVVRVEGDNPTVTAYFQLYRDGDVALMGGTGIFAQDRSMEQQRIVDMLFRRMLSNGRQRMDTLTLPEKKDDPNG